MNQKISKKIILKQIKELSNRLKPTAVVSARPIIMKGRIASANGTTQDSEGKEFEPNSDYKFHTRAANHYRQMKNAYERGGWEAVMKYADPFLEKKK